jgi:hypothetical protein
MSTLIRFSAAVILFFHGLIHLMGTVVYMRLGTLAEFPYKTTILGSVDLGTSGIYIFGFLWTLAAVGFFWTAVGFLAKWKWNTRLLVTVSIFSLVLTVLDWQIAYTGVLVNVVILALLGVESRRQLSYG